MKRDLHFDAFYPHPPEKVWDAITSSEAIARWLMKNDFAPRLGHKFQLRAQPVGGWDGVVHCEVLELDAPRRMSWAWRSNKLHDTVVTFSLSPASGGTNLHLAHTGFRGLGEIMVSFFLGSGWKGIVAKGILAEVDHSSRATASSNPIDSPADVIRK